MKLLTLFTISALFMSSFLISQQVNDKLITTGFFSSSCLDIYPENVNKIITLTGKVLDDSDGSPLIGANIVIKGTTVGTVTNIDGEFSIVTGMPLPLHLQITYTGYNTETVMVTSEKQELVIKLKMAALHYEEVVTGMSRRQKVHANVSEQEYSKPVHHMSQRPVMPNQYSDHIRIAPNTEQYGTIQENKFKSPFDDPLSTFSADVDRASYSNIRRFINDAIKPPQDAVRIEEMINYFDYEYEGPTGKDPLAIHQTLTECPWNTEHQILHIGLQAKTIPTKDLPNSNFVFLIDVSGSMRNQNKLPLVKSSLQNLVKNLRDEDKVAIVTYAGSSGVLLESTAASDKTKILNAIQSLGAGGSTAGAEGIKTAYKIAEQNFLKDGNNRIILASDGDFNVGIRTPKALEQLIEEKRKTGIFLSVLGYGVGNYKDEQMQILADKGNGNHAYIDNLQEANKVLVHEFGGTLFTLAKDVKLQIEFNPAYVSHYRLIGYENRLLNPEDFNDDRKDAGEIGSGHTVTALYEIIPVGSESSFAGNIDDLKYQQNKKKIVPTQNNEMATIKFRYKEPDGYKSKKIVNTISPSVSKFKSVDADIQFAIAVAEFGMLLRDSDFINHGNYSQVKDIAQLSRGKDERGYRAEFIRLVEAVEGMDPKFVSE